MSFGVPGPNYIGGPLASERNVVANCGENGIIVNVGLNNTTVENNYVGTDATGLISMPVGTNTTWDRHAVLIKAATNVVVKKNVVSGNTRGGIYLEDPDGVTITGNIVGMAADGVTPMGNAWDGIQISQGENHIIGGGPGLENNIAYNGRAGIDVYSCCFDFSPAYHADFNMLTKNIIHHCNQFA